MLTGRNVFDSLCNIRSISSKTSHNLTKYHTVPPLSTSKNYNYNGNSHQSPEINFSDAKSAYQLKTLYELIRSLTILRLCSIKSIASHSLQISERVEKIVGRRVFDDLMKKTFYGQFVGGDDPQTLHETVKYFEKENIRPMIACMMESEVDNDTNPQSSSKIHDNNTERILQCLRTISKYKSKSPKIQTKFTGLMSPKLLIKLQNVDRKSEVRVIENLAEHMLGNPLKTEILSIFLSQDEILQVEAVVARIRLLGNAARQHEVDVLIDAELVSLNRGIRLLTLALMVAFNKDNSHIWYTYQAYLKSVIVDIESDQRVLGHFGTVGFGAKLVRGAYMDQERSLARTSGYADPINDTYEDTSRMYSNATDLFLELAAESTKPFKITVATHNEIAILRAIDKMNELRVEQNPKSDVSFAQLMGMCDHTSHILGKHGLAVYKSMPYGTVSEVIPYLYRRAMENFSVLERTTKERKLIAGEIRRRLLPIKSS